MYHRVRHHVEDLAQPFLPGVDEPLLVAVMLRSDVFAAMQARCGETRPAPVDVFTAVSAAVAEHIRARPLRLPTLAQCSAEW